MLDLGRRRVGAGVRRAPPAQQWLASRVERHQRGVAGVGPVRPQQRRQPRAVVCGERLGHPLGESERAQLLDLLIFDRHQAIAGHFAGLDQAVVHAILERAGRQARRHEGHGDGQAQRQQQVGKHDLGANARS